MIRTLSPIVKNNFSTWPLWWQKLSGPQKAIPALFVGSYLSGLHFLNQLRLDHIQICAGLMVLSYLGELGHKIRRFVLPFIITGIVYDSQRIWGNWVRPEIHVSDLYLLEKQWFGVQTPQGLLSPNEFLQLHTYPWLDLMTGAAYLTFFSIFIIQTTYYLLQSKTSEDQARAYRMTWGFLLLNVLGIITYYLYPASPPWYLTLYGHGPAKLGIPTDPAGCSRFDQLLGVTWLHSMYSRAADDVHGAMPSLHVAYPLMATVYSFRFKKLQIFSILFYLLMCFSAVYLNHHYILDVLVGSCYALLTVLILEKGLRNFLGK